jgi:hypothetical protein
MLKPLSVPKDVCCFMAFCYEEKVFFSLVSQADAVPGSDGEDAAAALALQQGQSTRVQRPNVSAGYGAERRIEET